MLKQVYGNILDIKVGIVCHQVNCMLVMGSGIALKIKQKWPVVFTEYKRVMGSVPPQHRLGKCQIVGVGPNQLYVANLFGQFRYGMDKQHTDYNALAMALNGLSTWCRNNSPKDFPVYFPYNMGCGRGGGDWSTVSGIIESVMPAAIVVRLK